MMQIVKMSIVFMTTAIFMLVGLIIYKSFFEKSPSVSENTVIELVVQNPSSIAHFSFNEDEIAVMSKNGSIDIFSRKSGLKTSEYKTVTTQQ